jgi:hypothetical protein
MRKQVMEEVMRLEGRKADLIRGLIALKRRELEEVCLASHMHVPPQPEVDPSRELQGGATASAQVCIETQCLNVANVCL